MSRHESAVSLSEDANLQKKLVDHRYTETTDESRNLLCDIFSDVDREARMLTRGLGDTGREHDLAQVGRLKVDGELRKDANLETVMITADGLAKPPAIEKGRREIAQRLLRKWSAVVGVRAMLTELAKYTLYDRRHRPYDALDPGTPSGDGHVRDERNPIDQIADPLRDDHDVLRALGRLSPDDRNLLLDAHVRGVILADIAVERRWSIAKTHRQIKRAEVAFAVAYENGISANSLVAKYERRTDNGQDS